MNVWKLSGFLAVIGIFSFVLKGAPPQAKGDTAHGKEVFAASCEICHNADSTEDKIGPGMKGISKKGPHKTADGTEHKTHDDAFLRKQIMEGSSAMPPVGAQLSAKDMDDLMAYLHTL